MSAQQACLPNMQRKPNFNYTNMKIPSLYWGERKGWARNEHGYSEQFFSMTCLEALSLQGQRYVKLVPRAWFKFTRAGKPTLICLASRLCHWHSHRLYQILVKQPTTQLQKGALHKQGRYSFCFLICLCNSFYTNCFESFYAITILISPVVLEVSLVNFTMHPATITHGNAKLSTKDKMSMETKDMLYDRLRAHAVCVCLLTEIHALHSL